GSVLHVHRSGAFSANLSGEPFGEVGDIELDVVDDAVRHRQSVRARAGTIGADIAEGTLTSIEEHIRPVIGGLGWKLHWGADKIHTASAAIAAGQGVRRVIAYVLEADNGVGVRIGARRGSYRHAQRRQGRNGGVELSRAGE